jgi:Tfp pilus tip-associated adhesin PilY1
MSINIIIKTKYSKKNMHSLRFICAFTTLYISINCVQAQSLPEVLFADKPLYTFSGITPHLHLPLSVEFPITAAAWSIRNSNNQVDFANTKPKAVFLGYFNPRLCYVYTSDTSGSYFKPSGGFTDNDYKCGNGLSGSEFSGNLLNWATHTHLDLLRYTLTGGSRDVDNEKITILKGANLISENANNLRPVRIYNQNYMRSCGTSLYIGDASQLAVLSKSDYIQAFNDVDYATKNNAANACKALKNNTSLKQFEVRVEVCNEQDAKLRPEFCKQYPNNRYKPVGILQNMEQNRRFSLSSYLLLSEKLVHLFEQKKATTAGDYSWAPTAKQKWQADLYHNVWGGVLRNPGKFMGKYRYDTDINFSSNNQAEWDAYDGTLVMDANHEKINGKIQAKLASQSSLSSKQNQTIKGNESTANGSSIINYINQFGFDNDYRETDPIGELLTEGLRYLSNYPAPSGDIAFKDKNDKLFQRNPLSLHNRISAGMNSTLSGSDSLEAQYLHTDKFPIVTDWAWDKNGVDQPIRSKCEFNHAHLVTIADSNNWGANVPNSGQENSTISNNLAFLGTSFYNILSSIDSRLHHYTSSAATGFHTDYYHNHSNYYIIPALLKGANYDGITYLNPKFKPPKPEQNINSVVFDIGEPPDLGYSAGTSGTNGTNGGTTTLNTLPDGTVVNQTTPGGPSTAGYTSSTATGQNSGANGNANGNATNGKDTSTVNKDSGATSSDPNANKSVGSSVSCAAASSGGNAAELLGGSCGGNTITSTPPTEPTQPTDPYDRDSCHLYTAGIYGAYKDADYTKLLANASVSCKSFVAARLKFVKGEGSIDDNVRELAKTLPNKGFIYPLNSNNIIGSIQKAFQINERASGNISPGALQYDKKNNAFYLFRNDLYSSKNDIDTSISTKLKKYTVNSDGTPVKEADAIKEWEANLNASLKNDAKRNIIIGGNINVSDVITPKDLTYASLAEKNKDQEALDYLSIRLVEKDLYSYGLDSMLNKYIKYIRGSSDDEATDNITNVFRKRNALIGSSANSTPVYVEGSTRNMLYLTSNNGMLHGINADTGTEEFAYMPRAILPNLYHYAESGYVDKPLIESMPIVADIAPAGTERYASSDARQKLFISGFGAGAKGIFALNVGNVSKGEAFNAADVKFEFTEKDDADIGHIIGQPEIVRLKDNDKKLRTFIAVTSGYNNFNTVDRKSFYDNNQQIKNKTFVYLLATDKAYASKWVEGSNYYKIPVTDTIVNNGLSAPASYTAINGLTQTMYFGDLNGSLWRLDFEGKISKPTAVQVFSSKNNAYASNMPITAKPALAINPNGYVIATFGTGRYFGINDLGNNYNTQQLLIAVTDKKNQTATSNTITLSQLNSREIKAGLSTSLTEQNNNSGWYLKLPFSSNDKSAERMVYTPIIQDGKVIFTTQNLGAFDVNTCGANAGGMGAVDLLTGLDLNYEKKNYFLGHLLMLPHIDITKTLDGIEGVIGNTVNKKFKSVTNMFMANNANNPQDNDDRMYFNTLEAKSNIKTGVLSWRELSSVN